MDAIAPLKDIQIRGSPPNGPQSARPAPATATATATAVKQETPNEPPLDTVEKAAEGVNAFLKSNGNHIQFAVHAKTNRMMVEVIDDQTQEVIRTIPSKDVLDLAAKIDEMVGLLLDKKG
jgi:flagellar protein FlaG